MMGTKAPDFKIETLQELEPYLGLWTDYHVGVRVDHRVAEEVKRKIPSEEIPHKREVNENAIVAPNYTIGLVAMYYMLARSLEARYGIHFGHWTDDGRTSTHGKSKSRAH